MFVESWDTVEQYYKTPPNPVALAFVEAARKAGFDKTLRAGTMLSILVLSRSLEHGLRNDQSCIHVHFSGGRIFQPSNVLLSKICAYFDEDPPICVMFENFNEEVEAVLRKLEQFPLN